MDSDTTKPGSFDAYRALAMDVLQGIERLHGALGETGAPERHPGWRELKGRPFVWSGEEAKPWLVATLFGPTGSGKSTVFRLLTGLEVPAGDVIRPVTFNPLLAVPESIANPAFIQQWFPFNVARPLENFEQLKEKNVSRETLFYAVYRPGGSDWTLRLILADVPDFDTVYQANWEKAEDMMRRAEVVLFTLYPAAYMDHVVLTNLRKCCAHAGRLAVLFNKMESREQAELIHQDLLQKVASTPEFKEFRETRREDGRSLDEFLSEADAYWSPRSARPSLEAIQPLTEASPPLAELLTGLDGLAVLLASLREDTRKGVESCRSLCFRAESEMSALDRRIEIAEGHLDHAASIVAGTCFPAGHMTKLVVEVAREYRPAWLKLIGAPVVFFSGAVTRSKETLKRVFRGRTQVMADLEKVRLEQLTDDLLRAIRADLPEAGLTMERCQELRSACFEREPWPEPSRDWSDAVKRSAVEWALENPWKTTVLGTANEVLLFLGGAAIGVDLLVTGGQSALWGSVILGKLGVVGAAGAGGAAAAALLNFFERLGLRRTLELADRRWREQRRREIAAYLSRNLAGAAFLDGWKAERDALREAPLDRYRKACDGLERFFQSKPAHS